MVKDPNDALFTDVEEALYKRGHREVTVYRVYGPGDPEAALTEFGPATTALFTDATKKARTALIYAEAYVKKVKDQDPETDWRKVLIVREGWLAEFK